MPLVHMTGAIVGQRLFGMELLLLPPCASSVHGVSFLSGYDGCVGEGEGCVMQVSA